MKIFVLIVIGDSRHSKIKILDDSHNTFCLVIRLLWLGIGVLGMSERVINSGAC